MRKFLRSFIPLITLTVPLLLWANTDLEFLRSGEVALRDGLYDVAENHFLRVTRLEESPVASHVAAWLGVSRARLAAGNLEGADDALSRVPSTLPDDLDRWKTLVRVDLDLARGRFEDGVERLEALPRVEDPRHVQHMRLLARARHLRGESEAAIAGLRSEIEAHPEATGLRLELAEILLATNQKEEAVGIWSDIAANGGDSPQSRIAVVRMVQHELSAGDLGAAKARLDALLASGELDETLEPLVFPLMADALREERQYLQAAEILKSWEARLEDDPGVWEVRTQRAKLLVLGGELKEGDRILRHLIASRGDAPRIANAQLLLAEALAKTAEESGEWTATGEAYERYLSVFTDQEGLLRANLGLANVRERENRWGDAENLYERAWQLAQPEDSIRPHILMKWADVLKKREHFSAARKKYLQFTEEFSSHPLSVQAEFQAALCLAEVKGVDPALEELNRLISRHPEHPIAERAWMQRALLLSKFLRIERALGAYDAYLDRFPDGQFVADAMIDKGLAAYRIGLFDSALRQFDLMLERFPDHPRVEQAFLMRGWALYLIGREEEALRVGRTFLERFPDSPFVLDARFWLAEHAFNRRAYEEAEGEFLKLVKMAETPRVVSKAAYFAGRAAVARKNYALALEQFALSIDADPEAPHVREALFYQGDTLTELNRFDAAILVFDQLINLFPATTLALAARGRVGDCHFTLGQQDPARFQDALAAYRFVEESSGAPPDLRLQAGYKVGSALAALNRHDEALAQYMLVVNGYLRNRGRYSPETESIFRRAADAAAQAYEQRKDWRKAIQVYRYIVDSGISGAAEVAEERIQDLRREHLIFF
ncbi:MAG: tetratricopeptide repeat protein [Verrucomicrobia bacterium]|nr:tetratricopeptide repeat protein [Verrucomicrobiota bacterium]MCH8513077.1 tetratricopeptide repeat protein [Kiritimatiellia bacterium]